MSTTIESVKDDVLETDITITEENITDVLQDFSLSLDIQIDAIKIFSEKFPEKIGEYINKFCGMYNFSGTVKLREILSKIALIDTIPNIYRMECAYALLSYQIILINDEEIDKITIERNKILKQDGYNLLTNVMKKLTEKKLPTPCRLDSIYTLMCSPNHSEDCINFFREIVDDNSIDCKYRYKSILAIETRKDIHNPEFFLDKSFSVFLENDNNDILYRILAAQYLLLKKYNSTEKVQEILLEFASDNNLEYNLRADATDTLLRFADEDVKIKAKEIIMILGNIDGNAKTMFENAQNVHTEEIEKSVLNILEKLGEYPMLKIDDSYIDFNYVENQIEILLRNSIETESHFQVLCKHCLKNDETLFCSDECTDQYEIHHRIRVALNRIKLDRVLYSKYNNTLVTILLKIWSFVSGHENEREMKIRLLEELEEMSGTCSSGFATRLVNVISGFSEFNIRISWEEQIIANFSGRLNAMARKITHPNSVYFERKDIVEFFLKKNPQKIREIMYELTGINYTEKDNIMYYDTMLAENMFTKDEFIEKYLEKDGEKDREEKIKIAVEDFAENVYNEMATDAIKFDQRIHFLYFFKTSVSEIREEMYEEFKPHIDYTDFELYFRRAIMVYEGVL